ncbi:hypothetical protein [Providencia sp.]|uniref:hypothetical protein n=1 Tax=Providencia sp. TaxID=589 RepID=UPI001B3E18CE|nr:hypothetical protein [Providencia sp.]MBP6121082.1 hypothetical protein [Providencia sp.]
MNNTQSSQPAYDPELKGFNEAMKLIALHLVKTAITSIDYKSASPNVVAEIEKERATIDSDIEKQQAVVDALLNKAKGYI